jgi:hypothetical protein
MFLLEGKSHKWSPGSENLLQRRLRALPSERKRHAEWMRRLRRQSKFLKDTLRYYSNPFIIRIG